MQINNKNKVCTHGSTKYDSKNNKIFLVCKKSPCFTQKITTFLHQQDSLPQKLDNRRKGRKRRRGKRANVIDGRKET